MPFLFVKDNIQVKLEIHPLLQTHKASLRLAVKLPCIPLTTTLRVQSVSQISLLFPQLILINGQGR